MGDFLLALGYGFDINQRLKYIEGPFSALVLLGLLPIFFPDFSQIQAFEIKVGR
jgi:hypothetical protein